MRKFRRIQAELDRFREDHPPPVQEVSWQVRKLLSCTHEELFESDLSVRRLKERCSLRDNNVSCRFKHEMGISPKRYIESLRLEAACLLLRDGSFTASQVAHAVGYCHLQTFYHAFERRFHCTPGELKQGGAEESLVKAS